MTEPVQEKFIEEVIKVIDRWSFEQCASCENGNMVSIEGMLDFYVVNAEIPWILLIT